MKHLVWLALLVLAVGCQRSGPPDPLAPPPAVPAPATTAVAAPPAADRDFDLPGEYAQGMAIADFQVRFGAANVVIDEAPQEDGTIRRSVILFPDDPGRRAYVEFYDGDALAGVASITVRDAGSRWRGKHGVHVGMSFADLVRANDWPFGYYGFDAQGHGYAHDQWSPARGDEYRLGALDVADGEHMYFGVELGLRTAAATLPAGAWPIGEYVASDDPRFPDVGEIVEVTALVASTSLDDEWE